MKAFELINQVEQLGIALSVVGDKLRVNAQLGVITAEIKTELSSHKSEIIKLLSKPITHSTNVRVYRTVVEVDGVRKPMAVIFPHGVDLRIVRNTCNHQFGAERVISIEPWR